MLSATSFARRAAALLPIPSLLALLLLVAPAQAQDLGASRAVIDLALGVSAVETTTDSDTGDPVVLPANRQLRFGLDPEATNGLDTDLGELAPPARPSGFDVRFTSFGDVSFAIDGEDVGATRDYRTGDAGAPAATTHQIEVRYGNADDVSFAVSLPDGVTANLVDTEGPVASFEGTSSVTYARPTGGFDDEPAATSTFRLTVTYDGTQEATEGIPGVYQIDNDGPYSFGDLDLRLDLVGVTGSAIVVMRRLPQGPTDTDTIEDDFATVPQISSYRWVGAVQDDVSGPLSFDLTSEVRVTTDLVLSAAAAPSKTAVGITNPSTVQIFSRLAAGSFEALTMQPVETNVGDQAVLVAQGFEGLDEFVLASSDAANPLPVELAAFDAQTEAEDVVLAWATASETNNAGFAVEVQTQAGTWRELGFVAGAGTTTEARSYAFRAEQVGYGQHTFRLRQLDLDGTETPSDPLEVTLGLDEPYAVAAYPNPFRAGTGARVDVAVREAQRVEVAVYDVLGRRVATLFDGELAAERTRPLRLSAQGFASGVYFVRVTGETFRTTSRLTLVR